MLPSQLQWWDAELERAYLLHRARRIYDDYQSASRHVIPARSYLEARVTKGSPMPSVQLSSPSHARRRPTLTAGGQKRRKLEVSQSRERGFLVNYVLSDLPEQLYLELLDGLRLR